MRTDRIDKRNKHLHNFNNKFYWFILCILFNVYTEQVFDMHNSEHLLFGLLIDILYAYE